MNLVGLGLTIHDSSIAAYKNGKFLYRKAERETGVKHAHASVDWAAKVLKEWEIENPIISQATWLKGKDPSKITDTHYRLDHHYAHLLSSPKKYKFNYVVDAWSVGPGTDKEQTWYTGLVQDGDNIQRIKDFPLPTVLNTALWSKYFDNEKDLRKFDLKMREENYGKPHLLEGWFKDFLTQDNIKKHWKEFSALIDLPGKIMGLQAYGKPNMEEIKSLLQSPFPRTTVKSLSDNLLDIDINHIATVHKFCEQNVQQRITTLEPFGYSGGVAQNTVFNRAMLDSGYKPEVYPWAYDGGCSIGALNFLLDKHDIERPNHWEQDDQSPHERPQRSLVKRVAELIAQNKVVGWYQGHGEVGPRALGNRSILFNPAHKDGKATINKVKQREWWRPFGASVKEDQAERFFDLPVSRHMLYNSKVKYSGIPAVTHVDGTCRHQTVPQENELYYELLDEIEKLIDIPVVGNTSLNIKGKPIVATIEDAKKIKLDAICIGNELYENLHS